MKKSDVLESVLGRIEDLDSINLSNLVTRLARERQLFAMVLKALREGVLVIDGAGTILYANPSAAEMIGAREIEFDVSLLWKLVPDLARTVSLDSRGRLMEDVHVSREIELSYPDHRIIRVYMAPFEEEAPGKPGDRYAVILSDITQEKTQTEQQIQDERVNSILHLAAGVAHELGNPLNSLHIHLQVMSRQLAKSRSGKELAKLEKSLRICCTEVERLDSIITQFLGAVRPRKPDLADLNLVRALEETLEVLEPELSGHAVTVDVEIENAIPAIAGDGTQVKQVLFNVIKNAREAMNSGGTIRVRATSDDSYVYISIGDTGQGISREDLQRVFEPYFSRKVGGSGLGMMISHRIMQDHGGRIGIDSREGIGTIVTLQFPRKDRSVRLLEARE